MKRHLMAGAALALLIGVGGVAHATTFVVTKDSLFPGPVVTAMEDGRKVYDMDQKMSDATGKFLDFFCITPELTNHIGNVGGMILTLGHSIPGVSQDLLEKVQYLVNTTVGQSALYHDAVGDAVATIMDPAHPVTGQSNSYVKTESAILVNTTGRAKHVDVWAPTNAPFLSTWQKGITPSVPEPATWAMMLVGFGIAGASLRSRRRVVLNSAA